MSLEVGVINKILPNITSDIINNIGKHNYFVLVLNTEGRYPDKTDPLILRYDGNVNNWVYVADKSVINFGYVKETLKIEKEYIALSNIPLDKVIWDIFILDNDGNNALEIDAKKLTVNNNIVLGLESHIGYNIEVMYCYGEHLVIEPVVQVNTAVDNTYVSQNDIYLDEPRSDINDIEKIEFYDGEVRQFVNLPSVMEDPTLDMVGNEINILTRMVEDIHLRKITTTDKLEIVDSKVKLPSYPIGDIVNNIAIIFDDIDGTTIFEATCKINEDKEVEFDPDDELDGYFCVVSYLTY